MGLRDAPETLQTLMNNIFYGCVDEFLVVYMDDLPIFSNNEEDHMRPRAPHVIHSLDQTSAVLNSTEIPY
jgi:hypothetical protein